MVRVLRAVFAHPSGRIGGGIIALYLVVAALAALGLTPYDPLAQDNLARLHAPGGTHLMGTDLFGRDLASRLMASIGQSFTVAFFSVTLATLAGTVLGLAAAWLGGMWDGVVMRAMDVLLAFPAILLALLIVAIVPGPAW